ncbi:hypothetical protein [Microtetraspora malaysiensis]|uniref:hypothetical protein n=1 Tax=Microtetraspora malaysiensis TaxID=161358 RepID=UPI003D8C1088
MGHTLNPRKIAWTSVTPSADGRSLAIVWWSGVAPCTVLDRVEVEESATRVTVTLYEGRDPRHPDTACIAIALEKTTTVRLAAPLDGRQVVDGAK